MTLDPPFSYYGGKRRVADEVWSRFGQPLRYIEPFAGGLAMLLRRPRVPHDTDEIVNDLDGNITNIWRSIKHDPETVAKQLDRPIAELDVHAAAYDLDRDYEDFIEWLRESLDHYDAERAGLWLWAKCCSKGNVLHEKKHARPNIRPDSIMRPSVSDRLGWLRSIQSRLEGVTINCGDWKRCVSSINAREGMGSGRRTPVAIFFDPPYDTEVRHDDEDRAYAEDSTTVADEVREFCLESGDRDDYRLALCGMAGEHDMPDCWTEWRWQRGCGHGAEGHHEDECVWFSPGCQSVEQPSLLEAR